MQIVCPTCKTRFTLDDSKIGDQGVKLRCGKCKAVFRVARKLADISAPPSPGQGRKHKIIVANESEAFCSAVRNLLANESYEVSVFSDGRDTMKAIETDIPAAVLLDVALPSMFGFEICEAVRRNPALDNVKLILVASIYDKTKYKRTPSSLYGADAYIEKHHIPDSLPALIRKLVEGEAEGTGANPGRTSPIEPSGTADASHAAPLDEEATREALRRDEELSTTVSPVSAPQQSEDLTEATAKAKRLARIIVSDILLYNQDKVMAGIRSGNFHDQLKDEIREGRALYARRVPAEVAVGTAFLDEAVEQLISSKRQEMGL